MVMRCVCIMMDRIPDLVLEGKIKDEELIVEVGSIRLEMKP